MQRLEHSLPPRLAKPITCDIFVSAACSGARTNNEQISHTVISCPLLLRDPVGVWPVLNPPLLCQKKEKRRYAMLSISLNLTCLPRLAGLCCCWPCVPPCCFNVWGFILTMLEALLLFFYCAAKPPRALNTNKTHKCFLVCQNAVSVSVTCVLSCAHRPWVQTLRRSRSLQRGARTAESRCARGVLRRLAVSAEGSVCAEVDGT